MTAPHLSIRWKLFALLAAIALGPLLFIAWTDLQTLTSLGSTLASQSAEALGAQTRANLRQIAESQAEAIERQRRIVELLVRMQARDIERALRSPVVPRATPVWAANFTDTEPALRLAHDPQRYYRQDDATRRTPFDVSYEALSMYLAPRADVAAATDDAHRLAGLAPLFRELRASEPTLLFWQYASLANGLHASFPAHGGYPGDYDPRQRRWYTRQQERHAIDWSPPHTDVSTRLAMVSATMPLFDATNRFIGVTGIDVRVTGLLTSLRLPRHIADASSVLLTALDDRGDIQIIARNDHPDPGGDWQETRALERLQLDSAGDLAALSADMRAGANGLRTVADRGERQICVYRRLGDEGLYLVFLVASRAATLPAQDAADYALTTTRRQQDALLLLACLVAVVVGLLSVAAARAVTGPIETLERAVSAVADGDFSARVDIATGDELEALGDSFNAMIPRLEAHTRVQESLALAREVQQQLLPSAAPRFAGLDVAGLSVYCDETGGDYYDYLDLRDVGRPALGTVIGDVSGHGVAAALLMATARALLHGAVSSAVTPAAMIADLNRLLAADVRPGHFLTLFALVIDLDRRELSWSSAGHDAALWWQAATGTVGELGGDDIPLGIDRAWQFHASRTAPFGDGDVVMMTTDGLWEAQASDGERFGRARLRELLRGHHALPADELAQLVLAEVTRFRGDRAQRDDMTVVVIRVVHDSEQRELSARP